MRRLLSVFVVASLIYMTAFFAAEFFNHVTRPERPKPCPIISIWECDTPKPQPDPKPKKPEQKNPWAEENWPEW